MCTAEDEVGGQVNELTTGTVAGKCKITHAFRVYPPASVPVLFTSIHLRHGGGMDDHVGSYGTDQSRNSCGIRNIEFMKGGPKGKINSCACCCDKFHIANFLKKAEQFLSQQSIRAGNQDLHYPPSPHKFSGYL
jgi:hypothetical protein